MSKRNDNSDICMWFMAIWSMLMLMTLNQCTSQSDIKRELNGIRHEISMLKYK